MRYRKGKNIGKELKGREDKSKRKQEGTTKQRKGDTGEEL